jgi:hypothetical protein
VLARLGELGIGRGPPRRGIKLRQFLQGAHHQRQRPRRFLRLREAKRCDGLDMRFGRRPGLGDLDLALRAIEQAGAGLAFPGLARLAGGQGPARSLRPALLARPHPQGALGDADQLGGILYAQIALRIEPPRLDQALGGAFRFERHGMVRWMDLRNGVRGWLAATAEFCVGEGGGPATSVRNARRHDLPPIGSYLVSVRRWLPSLSGRLPLAE